MPSTKYVDRLEVLGPRHGESDFTFRCRLAAIREGRKLWLRAWRASKGKSTRAAEIIGIPITQMSKSLMSVGLTTRILRYLTGVK